MQAAKRDLIVSAKNLYLIGREKVKDHVLKQCRVVFPLISLVLFL